MSAAAEIVAALRKRNEEAWKLAVLASTAVQIEPELLRRLRLDLLPDSDASAEADLWLSDLVDSKSPDAAVLRTDIRTELQQELAADPARRDAAAAIVAKLHGGHSAVIQLQEQVTALMLRDDAASRTEIETLLQPIVRTLHESDHSGLARWAARAFGQLQPGVQLMQTPWLMVRAASLRLRGQGSGATSGAAPAGWSAVESSLRELPLVAVYVKMRRDGVTLTTVEGEGARLDIPATEPLLLEFAWDGPKGRETGRVAFAQGTEGELPLVPRNVTVTTLLGTEYEIRVPPQYDDWVVALTSADAGVGSAIILYEWAITPLGGAVPLEQSLILPLDRSVSRLLTFFEKISGAVHRRLYVFAGGVPHMTSKDVIDVFESIPDRFEEVVMIGEIGLEGSANEGRFQRFGPNGLFFGFEAGEAFTNAVVDGLNGDAAGDDGVVTARSLTNYVTETVSASKVRWQTWGSLSPLVSSDDFIVFVEFRTHLGPVDVLIRNDRGENMLGFSLSGTVMRRRLPRGLYSLDVPSRFLLLRFDTTLVNSVDIVPQSREEWILVAGTAEVTTPQRLFAEAFGRRLAGAGYRLLIGDWPGVDTITIESFTSTLARLDIPSNAYVRRFMFRPENEQGISGTDNVVVDSEDDEFERPLREAHAIVLIGGVGGPDEYATRAARAGVPVIPIAPTGGDAAALFHAGAPGVLDAVRDAPWQHEEIQDEDQADAMAMRAVELMLDHIKPWRQPEEPKPHAAETSPKAGTSPAELRNIREILMSILTPVELELLLHTLGRRLDEYVSPDMPLMLSISQVVETAYAQDWLTDLIVAAREAKPRVPELAELAARYRAAIAPPSPAVLSRILAGKPSMDMLQWRARLAELESRICRVEIGTSRGLETGTGFLIGPRAVMTTSLLLAEIFEHGAARSRAAFRFDVRATGGARDVGRIYRLADEWLIDASRADAGTEDLDYIIIQLNDAIGDLRPRMDGTPLRGWIELPTESVPRPRANDSLFIIHSTPSSSLKLAFGTDALTGYSADGTRLKYRVNTEPGSSGAPCFDAEWNLVAMHGSQASDTRFAEGVSMHAVVERLRQRGILEHVLA